MTASKKELYFSDTISPISSLEQKGASPLVAEIHSFYVWYSIWEQEPVIRSVSLRLLSRLLKIVHISHSSGHFLSSAKEEKIRQILQKTKEMLYDSSLFASELPSELQALYETLTLDCPKAGLVGTLAELEYKLESHNRTLLEDIWKLITPSLPDASAEAMERNLQKIAQEPFLYVDLASALKDATRGWITDFISKK